VKGPRTFRDRHDAGEQLGRRVADLAPSEAVVGGISRSGVLVGAEVARVLGAPLDIVVVRKLYGPGHVAVGAVAEHEVRVENDALVRACGLSREELREIVADALRDLARASERYRAVRAPLSFQGRTVVLVDGGLTTGSTAAAAAKAAFARGAARLILAVPVSPQECLESVRHEFDQIVCLQTPPLLLSISEWYEDYPQVSDEDVVAILSRQLASAG
jgi:putative phosphoribosyl transferase